MSDRGYSIEDEPNQATLTVLIMTLNEKPHIERCIRSVLPVADRVIVVDSGSSDGTQGVAQGLGAEVLEHEFESQARQLNWALDNIAIDTPWTMRIDADEYLTPELAAELPKRLATADHDTTAFLVKRRVVFMGRWIRHGGVYPTHLLRVWRTGSARSEDLLMDEHMIVASGSVATLRYDLVDENLRDLTWWTDKHNRYASREAAAMTSAQAQAHLGLGHEVRRRRMRKVTYGKLPPVARAWAYFAFRYVVKLGFLDGREGLIYHSLQGLWYRLLADAKALVLVELSREASPLSNYGDSDSEGCQS